MTAYKQLTPAEYSGLNGLWQQCFGDTAQEVAVFWRAVDGHVRVFAALDGEKAVSMLCALPVTLVDEAGDTLPAAYLYAICTAPERRNQGLAAGLTAYAENALRRQGIAATALVPANVDLFCFYKKLGYETVFFHREYTVPGKAGNVKLTRISADIYRNLREMQLYRRIMQGKPAAGDDVRQRGTVPCRDRQAGLLRGGTERGRPSSHQGASAGLPRGRISTGCDTALPKRCRADGGKRHTFRHGKVAWRYLPAENGLFGPRF